MSERELLAELRDEERVFLACVEDVLFAPPGLVHHRLLQERSERGADARPFVVLLVETNPAYDLSVSIELARRDFRLVVNGLGFSRPLPPKADFAPWVERRCRDLERLLRGDLRLEQETVAGMAATITLSCERPRHPGAVAAAKEPRWQPLARRDQNGWLGLLAFFVPYGALLVGNATRQRIYHDWWRLDLVVDPEVDPEPADEPGP